MNLITLRLFTELRYIKIDTTRQNLENPITSLTGVDCLPSKAFRRQNRAISRKFFYFFGLVSIGVSQTPAV
ncbi:MAG: hypothetical protein AAFQ91_33655 [Cyanobacteria bacterium J06621_15]